MTISPNLPTLPPHSLEAEQAVLSAILLDEATLTTVRDLLTPEDFYASAHQSIFRATCELATQQTPIDNLTLADVLARRGHLVKIGGAAYLAELLMAVASPTNIRYHAGIVAEKAKLRALQIQLSVTLEAIERGDDTKSIQHLLNQLRDATPTAVNSAASGLDVLTLSTVEPSRARWLWEGRIPAGMLTGAVGDPGLGKTTILCELAARASRGQLAGDFAGQPLAVCFCSSEDSPAHTLAPRLLAAGADLTRVHLLQFREGALVRGVRFPDDTPAIQAAMQKAGARMLVIDPLVAHLASELNSWRDQDIRVALGALSRLAEDCDAAVVFVSHLNKNSGAQNPLYRISASIGIPAAARSILWAARDPADESGLVLAHLKCNVGEKAPTLRYRIDSRTAKDISTSGIVWAGEDLTIRAEDLIDQPRDREERGERAEAKEWLAEFVGPEGVSPKIVLREADKAGFSERTIRRAKAELQIDAVRIGGSNGSWVWKRRGIKDGQAQNGGSLCSESQKNLNKTNTIFKDFKGCQPANKDKDGNLNIQDGQTSESEEVTIVD